jgi:hypothetical protein
MSTYFPKPPLLKWKDVLHRRDQYNTLWLFVNFAPQVWIEVRIITLPFSGAVGGNEYFIFRLYRYRQYTLTAKTVNSFTMTKIRTRSFSCAIYLPVCLSVSSLSNDNYIVSKYKLLINNELIGQVKSKLELVPAIIKALAWKDWEKTWKISMAIADLRVKIWTQNSRKRQPILYGEPFKNSRQLCRPNPPNYLNLRTVWAQLATTFTAVICLQNGQT